MRLAIKILFVGLSILIAVAMVRSGSLTILFNYLGEYQTLGSFIVGFFFTSLFTAAPAVAAFSEIMQTAPVWQVALTGGLGAAIGDMVLLNLIHKTVDTDVEFLLGQPRFGRLKKIFQTKLFHNLSLFIGALIVASPFPDELGLALMGVSNATQRQLFFISFFLNTLGVAALGYTVMSLIS